MNSISRVNGLSADVSMQSDLPKTESVSSPPTMVAPVPSGATKSAALNGALAPSSAAPIKAMPFAPKESAIRELGPVLVNPRRPDMIRALIVQPAEGDPKYYNARVRGRGLGGQFIEEIKVGDLTYMLFEIPMQSLVRIRAPLAGSVAERRMNAQLNAEQGVFIDRPVRLIEPVENIKVNAEAELMQQVSRDAHGVSESFEKFGYEGEGVKVGVIDTGFRAGIHDAIFGNRVKRTWSDFPEEPSDGHGHGMHVSGSAVGGKDPKSNWKGIAAKAELYSYKSLNNGGGGSWSTIIKGVGEAVRDDVDVINLSLGGAGQLPDLQDQIIVALTEASKKGIVVVVAAGNSGEALIGTPGHGFSVISVGAVDTNGTKERFDDRPAEFSSRGGDPFFEPVNGYGPEWEQYAHVNHSAEGKPNVAASGVKVTSTTHDGWRKMSGTSMASPQVTGIEALAIEYVRRNAPQMSKLDRYKLVVNSLLAACVPVKDTDGIRDAGPLKVGRGFVDAAKLYTILQTSVAKVQKAAA